MESFHSLVHEKEEEERGMRRKKCHAVMILRQDRHKFPC
jgi:hypothetical protein